MFCLLESRAGHQVVSQRPSVLTVELDIMWPSMKSLRSLPNLVVQELNLASLNRSETSQERSRDVGTSTMQVGSNNNSTVAFSPSLCF